MGANNSTAADGGSGKGSELQMNKPQGGWNGLASDLRQRMVGVHFEETPVAGQKSNLSPRVRDLYDGLDASPIGEGAFGQVWKVTNKQTKRVFACKSIRHQAMARATKESFFQEIRIIRAMDHPNVIKVVEVFVAMDTIHIVTDFCEGGELFDRLADVGYFEEARARNIATDMLRGLCYLHQNGIVHRDLKLENFLFPSRKNDKGIKLIDFGYSRSYLEGDKIRELVGTTFYMAPEVCAIMFSPGATVSDLKAADMWSLGVCYYMMLTGEIPIHHHSERDNLRKIASYADASNPKLGATANMVAPISSQGQAMINELTEPTPPKRLTASQAVHHEWFKAKKPKKVAAKTANAEADAQADMAKRIAHFRGFSELKRLVLTLTAFHFTPGKIDELNAVFAAIDKDGDGLITYKEFYSALANELKVTEGGIDVTSTFAAVDFDHTTAISYTEFTAACLEEKDVQARNHIIQAFRTLDRNQDGKITKEELTSAMPPDTDPALIEKIIADVDTNGDGMIDEAEFERAMSGGVVPPYSGNADDMKSKNLLQAAPGTATTSAQAEKASRAAMKNRLREMHA